MPIVIYLFALCAFFVGFAEFVTIGLVSAMAHDLQVDVARMGMAVTAYALGVVIGAPLLAALSSRYPRKHALLLAMGAFALSNLALATCSQLPPILLARLVSGLAHGAFFAIAASSAMRAVAKERSGAALALVFGGVTVAMTAGVPLGTWLGSLLGWRAIFLLVAAGAALGTAGIALRMPLEAAEGGHSPWQQLRGLLDKRLLAGASVPMLAFAGAFAVYTYISPLLLEVTGVSVVGASALLLVYGGGATLGNIASGLLTDRWGATRTAAFLLLGLLACLLGIWCWAALPWMMAGLVGLLGLTTYGVIAPLQSRIMEQARHTAPHALEAASGLNIAAFNLGVVLGATVGAASLDHFGQAGLLANGWLGALLCALALLALLLQARPATSVAKI